MARKIQPTSKQKRMFIIHVIVFAIAVVLMWTTYDKGVKGWAYPWPAWITAAWGLGIIGHWCSLYTSFEDPGMDEYIRQSHNG